MSAPELLGIALKEHGIELFAEAVDIEIFERGFRQLHGSRFEIAEAGLHGCRKAHILDCFLFHGNGIIKELSLVVDAGNTLTHQHDAVGCFGVNAVGIELLFPSELFVVERRLALTGHHFLPPVHDALILREEAVAADIHAVAVIADGLGDAADAVGLLQNQDIIRTGLVLEQLIGSREAGGACADNNHFFHVHIPFYLQN